MGGSVAVHAVLAIFTVPWAEYLSNQQLEASSIPVEWVELPPDESASDQPTSDNRPSASNPSSNPPPKIAGSVPPETSNPSPENAAPPPQSGDIGFASDMTIEPESTTSDRLNASTPLAPTPTVASPTPLNSPESSPSVPAQPVPPQTVTRPLNTEPDPESPDPESPTANGNRSAPDTNPDSASSPLPQIPNSPQLPASPSDSDGFQTFAIDRPPSDVSETIAIPEDPLDPSTLAQTDINQQATPVRLVTQVTFDRVPTAAAQGDNPEQIAVPRNDVATQVVSDPVTSPCFQLLQPTVMTSIGSTVVLQVATDRTGQVTQTSIYESSQNQAYDALAKCIVQSWEFNPATNQGEPVSSSATLVQIVINRD